MRNLINLYFYPKEKEKQQMSRKQKNGDREEAKIRRLFQAIPLKMLRKRVGRDLPAWCGPLDRVSRGFSCPKLGSGPSLGVVQAFRVPFEWLSLQPRSQPPSADSQAREREREISGPDSLMIVVKSNGNLSVDRALSLSLSLAFVLFSAFARFLSL